MHNVPVTLPNCSGTAGQGTLEKVSYSALIQNWSKFQINFLIKRIVMQNINLLHTWESLPPTTLSNHILLRFIPTASQHDYNSIGHEHL